MIVPHTLDLVFQYQLSTFQLRDLQIVVELCANASAISCSVCLMLPLKFCKMCFDSHIIHRFVSSDAKALRTFDWEIPNCRAIRDGVVPALKAARTAFT